MNNTPARSAINSLFFTIMLALAFIFVVADFMSKNHVTLQFINTPSPDPDPGWYVVYTDGYHNIYPVRAIWFFIGIEIVFTSWYWRQIFFLFNAKSTDGQTRLAKGPKHVSDGNVERLKRRINRGNVCAILLILLAAYECIHCTVPAPYTIYGGLDRLTLCVILVSNVLVLGLPLIKYCVWGKWRRVDDGGAILARFAIGFVVVIITLFASLCLPDILAYFHHTTSTSTYIHHNQ